MGSSTECDEMPHSKCRSCQSFGGHQCRKEMTFPRVAQVRDLGVEITCDFKPARQCQAAAQKARRELFRLKKVVSNHSPEVFLPMYKAIVRPHLEYCVQAWSPYLQKDIHCIEKVQRLATRMIAGQRGKSYEKRLADLDLFSMARRRLRGT